MLKVGLPDKTVIRQALSTLTKCAQDRTSCTLSMGTVRNVPRVLLGRRALLDLDANQQQTFAVKHINIYLSRIVHGPSNNAPTGCRKRGSSRSGAATTLFRVASHKAVNRRREIRHCHDGTRCDQRGPTLGTLPLKCVASSSHKSDERVFGFPVSKPSKPTDQIVRTLPRVRPPLVDCVDPLGAKPRASSQRVRAWGSQQEAETLSIGNKNISSEEARVIAVRVSAAIDERQRIYVRLDRLGEHGRGKSRERELVPFPIFERLDSVEPKVTRMMSWVPGEPSSLLESPDRFPGVDGNCHRSKVLPATDAPPSKRGESQSDCLALCGAHLR